MNKYEENIVSIQAKHGKMFENDTYTFHPNDELVMSMPIEFIDGLKVGTWTCIKNRQVNKLHQNLKQAVSSSMHIGRS
jgi:hypothetical protein